MNPNANDIRLFLDRVYDHNRQIGLLYNQEVDFDDSLLDLTDLSLSLAGMLAPDIVLAKMNLPEADLRNTLLERANLHRTNLKGSNLETAILQFADLSYATFDEANLSATNLTYSRLIGTRFKYAKLHWAHLEGAVALNGTDFEGADMKGANLKNLDLTKAKLLKTDLSEADIESARFSLNEHLLSTNFALARHFNKAIFLYNGKTVIGLDIDPETGFLIAQPKRNISPEIQEAMDVRLNHPDLITMINPSLVIAFRSLSFQDDQRVFAVAERVHATDILPQLAAAAQKMNILPSKHPLFYNMPSPNPAPTPA